MAVLTRLRACNDMLDNGRVPRARKGRYQAVRRLAGRQTEHARADVGCCMSIPAQTPIGGEPI